MAKVMIVDDQHDLIVLVTLCMKAKGHTTRSAFNRRSLLEALVMYKPDVIILDVMLGAEDGRQICKELKQSEFKNIPILLYSACRLMLDHFEDYDANDSLEKPFNVSDLQDKVAQLINS